MDIDRQPFTTFYEKFGKKPLVALLAQYNVEKVSHLNKTDYEQALRDIEFFTICYEVKRKTWI